MSHGNLDFSFEVQSKSKPKSKSNTESKFDTKSKSKFQIKLTIKFKFQIPNYQIQNFKNQIKSNLGYCYNHLDGNWYEYDDSRVRQVDESFVENIEAYILVTNAFPTKTWSLREGICGI